MKVQPKCFSFPVWETPLGEGQQLVSVPGWGREGGAEILSEKGQTLVRLGWGGGGRRSRIQ